VVQTVPLAQRHAVAEADTSLTLSILKEIRAELNQQRTLLLQLVDAERRQSRRISDVEHRINDLVPELELMLKGEIMGRLANFESRVDLRIDELAARLEGKTPPAA
jgi:hypothetical protein